MEQMDAVNEGMADMRVQAVEDNSAGEADKLEEILVKSGFKFDEWPRAREASTAQWLTAALRHDTKERSPLVHCGYASVDICANNVCMVHVLPTALVDDGTLGAHIVMEMQGDTQSQYYVGPDAAINSEAVSRVRELLKDSRVLKLFASGLVAQIEWLRRHLSAHVIGCAALDLALDQGYGFGLLPDQVNVLSEAVNQFAHAPSAQSGSALSGTCLSLFRAVVAQHGKSAHLLAVVYESTLLSNACFCEFGGVSIHAEPWRLYVLAQALSKKRSDVATAWSNVQQSTRRATRARALSASYWTPSKVMDDLALLLPSMQWRAHSLLGPAVHAAFSLRLQDHLEAVQMTQRDLDVRDLIARDIAAILERKLGPGKVEMLRFGSSATGFALRGSDLDLCALMSPGALSVNAVKRALQSSGQKYSDVRTLPNTRVPIVKFNVHVNGETIECDMSLSNSHALYNTDLLQVYGSIEPRLKGLIIMVKAWAKAYDMVGAAHGLLSSYAHSLLVIFYMQRQGLLPNLQNPDTKWTEPPPPYLLGTDNVAFLGSKRCNIPLPPLPVPSPAPALSSASFSELLMGFFHYYAYEFDHEDEVVSVRSNEPIRVADKCRTTPDWRPAKISIEDPFILNRNLGHYLSISSHASFAAALRGTYRRLLSASTAEEALAIVTRNHSS